MLGVLELAALIQINPCPRAALQLRPGLPGPRGSGPFGRIGGQRACLHEEWNETEPKVRVGGSHDFVAILRLLEQAGAIDLTGGWATSADECKNVFVRKGGANKITFAPMSELHGGGFIVEPNRSVGRAARCTIKAKKDDAQTMNILASCASDIMLSNVQFELNVVNPDKVRRLFPGMEDMEIFYYRCQI